MCSERAESQVVSFGTDGGVNVVDGNGGVRLELAGFCG